MATDTKIGTLRAALLRLHSQHEAAGSLPTSGRFLFYELVADGTVDKTNTRRTGRGADQDVNEALAQLWEEGLVPCADVADETRTLHNYNGYDTVAAGAAARHPHIRLTRWAGMLPPTVADKWDARNKSTHPSVETEALSRSVIVGILRDRLDDLLPEPCSRSEDLGQCLTDRFDELGYSRYVESEQAGPGAIEGLAIDLTKSLNELASAVAAAQRLGISRANLYLYIASGDLHSFKMDRARRIPVSALEDFRARHLEEEANAAG
jgi:hypothetical protein